MRRTSIFVMAVVAAAAASLAAPSVSAEDSVTSVVQAVDAPAGRGVLFLFGKRLTRFSTYQVRDPVAGVEVATAQILFRSAGLVAVAVPADVAPGDYDIVLSSKRGQPEILRVAYGGSPVRGGPGPSGSAGVRGVTTRDFTHGVEGVTSAAGQDTSGVHAVASDPTATALLAESVGAPAVRASVVVGSGRPTALEATVTSPEGGVGVAGRCNGVAGLQIGVRGDVESSQAFGVFGFAASATGSAVGVGGTSLADGGTGVFARIGGVGGVSSTALLCEHLGATGNLALFRTLAGQVARIGMDGAGYFNGGVNTSGADFAERVRTSPSSRAIEPGDVVAIDTAGRRRFVLCETAESTLVAGVVSTRPGILASPRAVAGAGAPPADEAPLALVGIVPCKVCDEGGAVRAGDLLVSASVPGHAKKAPSNAKPGTIVGKALEPLEGTAGKIEVLLTLR
jgi:hypothetical protein